MHVVTAPGMAGAGGAAVEGAIVISRRPALLRRLAWQPFKHEVCVVPALELGMIAVASFGRGDNFPSECSVRNRSWRVWNGSKWYLSLRSCYRV